MTLHVNDILNLSIKFHHIQHDMKNSSNLKCIILYIGLQELENHE